jgi:uncharacterized protein
MYRVWLLIILLAGAGWTGGCRKPATVNTSPPPRNSVPTQAQPKLQTIKLWLGSKELTTELALTQIQVQTGMMFRTNIAETEAMLFVFPAPFRASFWMKNTLIPLSCAYLDSDGVILETHDMKPRDETSIEAGSDNVRYVLETRQGWFERNSVNPGTVVRTEHGSLAETFFRGN